MAFFKNWKRAAFVSIIIMSILYIINSLLLSSYQDSTEDIVAIYEEEIEQTSIEKEQHEEQQYDNDILNKLYRISMDDQIKQIHHVYHQIFGDEILQNFSIASKLNKISSNQCIILTTATFSESSNSKYNVTNMEYAYLSKFIYSQLHSYIFIIDAINYMEYLNIDRKIEFVSPSYSELNNLLKPFKKEHGDEPIITQNMCYSMKDYDDRNKRFIQHKILSNHWNKVLSQLYWSKYFKCILYIDDDGFIGNYNLTIDYWLNLSSKNKKMKSTFIVLPYDTKDLQFSNFAFIVNDIGNDRYHTKGNLNKMQNFYLSWFNNKDQPFSGNDQGAMYQTIAEYLFFMDNDFKNLQMEKKNGDKLQRFEQCIDFCSNICPKYHACLSKCYYILDIHRALISELKKSKYTMSVLWTPLVATDLKYLSAHDNLEQYPYEIYPFCANLNRGSLSSKLINGNIVSTEDNFELIFHMNYTNALQKLTMILDKTYLIHYRMEYNNPKRSKLIRNEAVKKLNIYSMLNTMKT